MIRLAKGQHAAHKLDKLQTTLVVMKKKLNQFENEIKNSKMEVEEKMAYEDINYKLKDRKDEAIAMAEATVNRVIAEATEWKNYTVKQILLLLMKQADIFS